MYLCVIPLVMGTDFVQEHRYAAYCDAISIDWLIAVLMWLCEPYLDAVSTSFFVPFDWIYPQVFSLVVFWVTEWCNYLHCLNYEETNYWFACPSSVYWMFFRTICFLSLKRILSFRLVSPWTVYNSFLRCLNVTVLTVDNDFKSWCLSSHIYAFDLVLRALLV